jgi:hypothetical protein
MTLPYNDPRIGMIKNKYGVVGIPMLIIINSKTGEVVRKNAR